MLIHAHARHLVVCIDGRRSSDSANRAAVTDDGVGRTLQVQRTSTLTVAIPPSALASLVWQVDVGCWRRNTQLGCQCSCAGQVHWLRSTCCRAFSYPRTICVPSVQGHLAQEPIFEPNLMLMLTELPIPLAAGSFGYIISCTSAGVFDSLLCK